MTNSAQPAAPGPAFARAFGRVENTLASLALLLMAGLPVLELILRTFFRTGVTGAAEYVQHLTLWVGFLGAAIAAREHRHLSLSEGIRIVPERLEGPARVLSALVSVAVAAGLTWASLQFVRFEMESAAKVGSLIPVWMVQAVLPLAFALIMGRFIWRAGGWRERAIAALGLPLAYAIGFLLEPYAAHLVWPSVTVLVAFALLGAPIFVVLGGITLMLFFAEFVPAAAIPVEAYRIAVSPSIPAIPLFTLAGFVLAESRSSQRLVRLFRELTGWLPGGMVLATTLVCAFFSTFTGASGVTILALGGLLLPVLLKNGFRERFSTGLLTATGSIGLLFPPSLAVILYGVVAHVPIPDLFVAGIVPGLIMVGSVAAYGIWQGRSARVKRQKFDCNKAWEAMKIAKWEIFLPFIVLTPIFGGFTSLIEAAAITAVYTIFTETVIHRDIRPFRDLPGILVKCITMLGGIFVILGVAMGFTNFMVDAFIPMKAAAWVEANVESKIVFLLALNVFLLFAGAVMDIFSAIVVVVPLIAPIAAIYGIHPLHLGMIFLVNLELGYLTPPVGMNLFLASYRLEKPLIEVYKATLPFFIVLVGVVLLVTYAPQIIIGAH